MFGKINHSAKKLCESLQFWRVLLVLAVAIVKTLVNGSVLRRMIRVMVRVQGED